MQAEQPASADDKATSEAPLIDQLIGRLTCAQKEVIVAVDGLVGDVTKFSARIDETLKAIFRHRLRDTSLTELELQSSCVQCRQESGRSSALCRACVFAVAADIIGKDT